MQVLSKYSSIFREKYFAMGEMTRREKKERKSEEMAAYALYKMAANRDVT